MSSPTTTIGYYGEAARMAGMEKLIPIAKIQPNPIAPERRTQYKLARLTASMKEFGQFEPIFVDPANAIIHGTRRVEVAKRLGWKFIRAWVYPAEYRDVLYFQLGTTNRGLSGNDMIALYLVRPSALPKRLREEMQGAEEAVGRVMLRRIYDRGRSLRIVRLAKIVATYCLRHDQIKMILQWLLDVALNRVVEAAIAGGYPATKLYADIVAARPVMF